MEHVPGHVGRERSRSRSRSSSHAILLSLEHPKAITSISNLSHTRDGAPALENPDDLPLRGIPREIHQTKGQHQMRDTRRHTYHTVVPSSPSHGIIIRDSAQPGGRPESGLNTLRDAQAPTTGVLHSDVLRRRDKKLRPEEPGQQFTLGRGARPTSNSIRASHTANKSTSEPQVAEMIEVEREENIAQEFTALVAVVAKEQDVVDANAPVYKPMSSLGAKDPSATPRKPGTAVPNVPKRPSPNDSHAKDEKTTSVIPEQDAEPTPRHQASLTPLSQPGPTKEAGGELPQAPSETEAGIIINPVATIRSVGGSVDIVATKVDQQENFSDPQTHRRESFVAVPRSNAPKGSKKAKTGKKRGARSAPDSEPLRGAAATPSDPPEQYKVEETLKYSTDLPSTPPPTTQISSSPNVAVSRASSHPTAIMIPTPNTNPASIPQEAEFEAEIITVPDLAQGKSKGKWNRAQAAQQKQYREADTGLLLPPSNQPNHIEHLDIHPPLSIMPTPIKNSASIASQPRSRQQCIENIAEKGIDVATSSSFPTSSMQSTSCQQAKKLLEDEIRERIRRNEQAMEAAIRIRTHQRELHEERRKAFNLEREIQKAKDELETLRAEKLAADQERMDVVAQAMDKSQSELRQKLGEISNLMSLNHVASLEDPSKVKRSQELDTMEDQQIESIKALIQQISAQNRDQYRQAAEAPNASQTRSG